MAAWWRESVALGVRQLTGELKGMKESHSEEIATHTGPESCAAAREDRKGRGRPGSEALTGVRIGQVLSCERRHQTGKADVLLRTEGNTGARVKGGQTLGEHAPASPRSETLCMCGINSYGNWEIS